MQQNIDDVVHLITESSLDQTIKEILIRDLEKDGLTDFLREQIKAYCLEGIKKIDAQIEAAEKLLVQKDANTPPL